MNDSHEYRLAGIDLAWKGDLNPSSIAIGRLIGHELVLEEIHSGVIGLDSCMQVLDTVKELRGIAIDASLIINNSEGYRSCELELNQQYRSRWASCYPTNLKLYPDAFSVQLFHRLQGKGFNYLSGDQWQIECYPHASMIEVFGLAKRLSYKKGDVAAKREGQKLLASLIVRLEQAQELQLIIPEDKQASVNYDHINSLRGKALKNNEDNLDAIICLYTAGLYAIGSRGLTFGDKKDGAIWVPQGKRVR
ncbi:DUF429 domain-containing protein [Carboxylicivirga sp. RSCT41]|uniref:DUF429 domain-containing protein n=1 Tax=Carboxylicivirga agarovorans TaxID=3417570 RepID=UPI003D331304